MFEVFKMHSHLILQGLEPLYLLCIWAALEYMQHQREISNERSSLRKLGTIPENQLALTYGGYRKMRNVLQLMTDTIKNAYR